jgi:hypothetical protein
MTLSARYAGEDTRPGNGAYASAMARCEIGCTEVAPPVLMSCIASIRLRVVLDL